MRKMYIAVLFTGLILVLGGCASQYQVKLKVHTEPEGSHVVLRQGDQPWTYLGTTPLNAVETIDEEVLKSRNKITLKTMRCGYLDQIKEWTNDQFKDEIDDKGNIFWTPRLIKNIE